MKPEIPVLNESGDSIATLHALSAQDVEDAELVQMLSDWRAKYSFMFMTQFAADLDRTRLWLAKLVASDQRLMFIIRGLDGTAYGQFGLRWNESGIMELDNGILGNATAPNRLFYHTERAVLHWGFESIGAHTAVARVFSKNIFAIKLHKAVGLVEVRREPLSLTVTSNRERHYSTVPFGTPTDVPFELVTLEVQRAGAGDGLQGSVETKTIEKRI